MESGTSEKVLFPDYVISCDYGLGVQELGPQKFMDSPVNNSEFDKFKVVK